jgi:very-short-patch-repair endonuclease
MSEIYNKGKLFSRRRILRNEATLQENILWRYLKNSNTGFKFRRQYSVDSYILDFYCPSKKIAIELDGSQHFEDNAEQYGIERTKRIASHGIHVLRFTNIEINTNLEGVLLKIQSTLEEPPLAPP